jgi:hypothetical protein
VRNGVGKLEGRWRVKKRGKRGSIKEEWRRRRRKGVEVRSMKAKARQKRQQSKSNDNISTLKVRH